MRKIRFPVTLMLSLRLLGPPQIRLNDRLLDALSSAKSQALLFYLALNRGPQSRLALAGLLWPDKSDAEARVNLRQALYQLRQALPDTIITEREHITLSPEAVQEIDVIQFEAELGVGLVGNVEALHTAADRYDGDFLTGFYVNDAPEFEEWLLVERERLRNLALQALHQLATYYANCREIGLALQYTGRLLALEPLREEAHQLMMRLLAWDGQLSAALAHYDRCRELLATELGVEPSVETTALAEAIRSGQLAPARVVNIPQRPSIPQHLPPQATAFIGRESELAALATLYRQEQPRLITITGPGGIGKTRLALAYGEQQLSQLDRSAFPDGIYFVSFANLTRAPDLSVVDHISLTIGHALGLALERGEEQMTSSPKQPLLDYVRDKRLLLLLDDFEDLAGGSLLLAEILQAAPHVHIVVTSRERLNLYEERVFTLKGLALPDLTAQPSLDEIVQSEAVRLFLGAARRVRHDFQLQPQDYPTLVEVCHFLMGMPLALEMAAAWVDTLSVSDILQEIRLDLGLLNTHLANVPVRHRSLSGIFDYAWQRLALDEQIALAAFAVFQGGCTLSAAQRVAGSVIGQPVSPRILANLVHKSLLVYDQKRDRYELHELVRRFATAQLVLDEAQESSAHHAHCAYYCAVLYERQDAFKDARQQTALAEAEMEAENIRAAWHWAVAQRQVQLISSALDGLFYLYDTRSWFLEGETILREAALRLGSGAVSAEEALMVARLEARQGWFTFHLGRAEESMRLLRKSLMRLWQLGHDRELAFSLNYLGAVLRHQEQYEQANVYLTSALQLAQRIDDRYLASISLNTLGQTAWLQGDYALARRYCEEGLQLKREIGDRRGMMYSLTYLGRVAEAQGDYAEAQRLFEESMQVSQTLNDRRGIALAWQNLGDVAAQQQHFADAAQAFQQSVIISREIGDRLGSSHSLIRLGEAELACGELTQGRNHIRDGLRVALDIRSDPMLLAGILAMANLWRRIDQPDRAWTCLCFVERSPHLSPAQQQQAQQLRLVLEALNTSRTTTEAAALAIKAAETFVREWVLKQ